RPSLARAASKTFAVPTTLTRAPLDGSWRQSGTCQAARWMMRRIAWWRTTRTRASRSAMSPRTIVIRRATSSPAIIRGHHGSSPTSKTTGRSPSASSPRTTHEPMQPNAPVTRVAMAPNDITRRNPGSIMAAVPHKGKRGTLLGFPFPKEIFPMSPERPLVVLAGPIHADGHANLEREARVVVCTDETEAGLVKMAADAQGILFRAKPRCTESLMAACKQLKVVGRHGVGLDTVDIPAATRLGVAVVHAPGSNSQAVAEHALMLMLNCVKRTLAVDKATRAADWGAPRSGNTELAGKTLG